MQTSMISQKILSPTSINTNEHIYDSNELIIAHQYTHFIVYLLDRQMHIVFTKPYPPILHATLLRVRLRLQCLQPS